MMNADATPAPSRSFDRLGDGSVLPGYVGAHRPGRRRIRPSTFAMWAWMALALGVVATALVFFATGGRWFIIETPSMGQTAPVGTLVLNQPTTVSDLAVGDIISFHPPTAPSEVYTHRVVAIDDGRVTTKGDINGVSDPWTLADDDLIGATTAVLPGVGWIIRCLPYLFVGGLVVWIVTRFARTATRRASWLILGWSLVASITVFIVKPFVGIIVLTTKATQSGATANLVSTGLLPIRVRAVGGSSLDLLPGQTGMISVPTLSESGNYKLETALNLGLWGWVVMALVCALPLLWCLIVGLPPEGPDESARVIRKERLRALTPRAVG